MSGNLQPEHWTISEFCKRHHKALGELFGRTVAMADRGGPVRLRQMAIDGTKIKANALEYRAMKCGRIK